MEANEGSLVWKVPLIGIQLRGGKRHTGWLAGEELCSVCSVYWVLGTVHRADWSRAKAGRPAGGGPRGGGGTLLPTACSIVHWSLAV